MDDNVDDDVDDETGDSEYGDSNVTGYIYEKFNESKNIDKTFRNISYNVSARYYLGFKDYETLNRFINTDLYSLYFISFPNTAATIFCFVLIIVFIPLITCSIKRFRHKDVKMYQMKVLIGQLSYMQNYGLYYHIYFSILDFILTLLMNMLKYI